MNNYVVSYRSLQCCLDFQYCNICIQPVLKGKLYEMMEVEQTGSAASGEAEVLTSLLPYFAAAYLCQFDVCRFFWSPTNLLNPARRVYISAGLVGWVALWVVLMNSGVSTREGKRVKGGGLIPLQGQVDRLRAVPGAVPCEGCWGGSLLITCKGSFDFFRQRLILTSSWVNSSYFSDVFVQILQTVFLLPK